MGGETIREGADILRQAGMFVTEYPDFAVRVFNLLSNRRVVNVPRCELIRGIDVPKSRNIIYNAAINRRSLLCEYESKQLMSAYGINVAPSGLSTSIREAVGLANEFGYPVVLKLHSYTITHKSDVGGVKVNIKNDDELIVAYSQIQNAVQPVDFAGVLVQKMIPASGYELIVGVSQDPQFGPVILFGLGGVLVEVLNDTAIALPPLNREKALELILKTKISKALKGVRGKKPVDIDALVDTLVRVSTLVENNPLIKEIDLNPILASENGIVALDARVILDC
jgi:acetyltransferase